MNEIKAQALAAFWLTLSEIEIPECGDNNNTSTQEGGELAHTDGTTTRVEMELFFNQNLSNLKYKEATEMINEATDGRIKMRPTKDIYKESRELVKKIVNTVNT